MPTFPLRYFLRLLPCLWLLLLARMKFLLLFGCCWRWYTAFSPARASALTFPTFFLRTFKRGKSKSTRFGFCCCSCSCLCCSCSCCSCCSSTDSAFDAGVGCGAAKTDVARFFRLCACFASLSVLAWFWRRAKSVWFVFSWFVCVVVVCPIVTLAAVG